MKTQFVRQILVVALIAISGLAFSQESVMLKYNFVKGKTYVSNTHTTQNTTTTMGGMETKILSEINSAKEYTIESVEKDGSATALVTSVSITVHSSMPGMDTTMNFSDLKDKSRVIFSVEGKPLSSVRVDSSDISVAAGSMDIENIRILPAKSVKVGEKWPDKIVISRNATGENPFSFENTGDMEYTLVGKETRDGNDCYKIKFTGTMNINRKGTQMGMEMFIEGTGKVEGFFYFNPKISMPAYSEETTEMDMNIAVQGQQNMTIPMTQSMKTITTFEEKK